ALARRDRWAALLARRVRVDQELGSERRAVALEPAREDAVHGAVLPGALPGHDERAGSVEGDGRCLLAVRRVDVAAELRAALRAARVRIDREFRTGGGPVARVALPQDRGARPVREALPDDDERAGVGGGDRRVELGARGVAVHPELGSERRSVARVSSRVDT